MTSLYRLVRNETLKIWKKKRFLVIVLILLVLIPIFTYAQYRVSANIREQMGTDDWRIRVQQQIQDYTSRVASPRIPEEWKRWYRISIRTLEYHLEHDIDPSAPNAVTFAREFVENAVGLFLPLMVMVIASDLVSSERSTGTIKLLLTRPVRRWKVLLGKHLALVMYVSLIVMATAALCYLLSGPVFGFGGWNAPVLTGFEVTETDVSTDRVRAIPAWQMMMMELGLTWYSCLITGLIALTVSVLVRSTPAGMGIMLAALIAGTILVNMVSSWESAKYLFMVNLDTVAYLTGEQPPVPGMTLPFSLAVLSVWGATSVAVSFMVFTRQDILN